MQVIKNYQEIERNQWIEFVASHPNGNIFHTPEMFNLYNSDEKNEPIFLSVLTNDRKICGLLIAYIYKEYKGFIGEFTSRAIIWGGPLVVNQNPGIADLLLSEFNKISRKKVIYSQFRNLWDVQSYSRIFALQGYTFKEHLNILNDLTLTEDIMWKKIASNGRNKINKAIHEGIKVNLINDKSLLKEVYAIIHEVYKKVKLPLPNINYFEKAWEIFYSIGYLKCFGAFNNEKLIGVRLELTYKKTVYDWYAGSLIAYYNNYPNDILPWEIIKWSAINGYEIFDFGGAGKPGIPYGVRDYKMKFGGELVNFGRYEKVHKPLLMIIAKGSLKVWRLFK